MNRIPDTRAADVGARVAGRRTPALTLVEAVTIAASAAASALNLWGGLVFDSKTLIINGLTCIANFVAALVTAHLVRMSLEPPDRDHPFGHSGLGLGASAIAIVIYAFVLGLSVDELANLRPYRVSSLGLVIPAVVMLLYSASYAVGRRYGGAYSTYSSLTTSEIAESAVAMLVIPLASAYGYWIDWAGAVGLLAYYSVQVALNLKSLVARMAMPAASRDVYEGLIREATAMGAEVRDLRLRVYGYDDVGGYMVIAVPPGMDVREAHEIADRIESAAMSKYRVRLMVHVEPKEESKA